MFHDVFICHASEDKEDFVRPLAEALRDHHLDVWYDEFALTVGDSLREAIDRGLANSRFGIVVLSPHFFQKRWSKRELGGLIAREVSEDRQIVLPIWHCIGRDEVAKYSPTLADVFSISSTRDMCAVVSELLKRLRPEVSPLIVARDFLIGKGVTPPVVTDERWLDLVAIMEAQFRFPDRNLGRRWIFPLAFPDGDQGRERGLNIAWSSLQMDWAVDGEEQNICQLTRPEVVQEFLRKWPGLLERSRANPGVLAMYAPQLTIPGFDDGLADVFDALLDSSRTDAYQMPGYGGRSETTDGMVPLCGELIAWRHPTFGNYTDKELADSFVSADDFHYSRKLFSSFECLAWLLSDGANWMPQRLRERLIQGMRDSIWWWFRNCDLTNAFSSALFNRTRSRFRFTREIRAAINELFAAALQKLGIEEIPTTVAERFIARGFVDGFYDEQDRIRLAKKGRH